MNVSKVSTIADQQSIQHQKTNSPNFGVKLSLSREASKYMAESAQQLAIKANDGVADTVSGIIGQNLAMAIDHNINKLASALETIKPLDYPVTLDLTENCKKYFTEKGTCKGFDNYKNDEFELCPKGMHFTGKPYIASFSLNWEMLNEQFDRLYYVVTDRIEHGWWR